MTATAAAGAAENIAAHLPRVAREQPEALAIAIAKRDGSYVELTSAELEEQSNRAVTALRTIGITEGMRTVLMVTPSVEFFAITFALFKLGAVPVMVDPGMGVKNLGRCLAEAEPEAFLGIPKAQLARRLFGWARSTIRISVVIGRRLFRSDLPFAELMEAAEPAAGVVATPGPMAAILFTSGSTGTPKGVVYTHATFQAQVRSLRDVFGIEPGEVDLSTFPLFALFGPALGMTSVVPWMDASRPSTADPRNLVKAIHDYSCTNVFVNPTLVRLLGNHCTRTGDRLASVRRVLSAGAPAVSDALEELDKHLSDGVQIFTPYGATEALPVSSIGSREILEHTRLRTETGDGVCVGKPVPGVEIAIIEIDEQPIETWSKTLTVLPGEIGEIVVRGDVVTASYWKRPDADLSAKIPDRAASNPHGFWHRMGDVGYLDGQGRLWMCGRKNHRVETEGGTLFTIPCESVFNQNPWVRRTALVGVGQPGQQRPVLCVERHRMRTVSQPPPTDGELRKQLLEMGQANELTKPIRTILFHPRFPVDVRHNAKIFRERLAVWANRRLR